MEYAEICLSVRTLVEYAYASGSIEPGFRSAAALSEGTRIHQHIQRQYKEVDRKEVYLKTELTCGGLRFVIDGRCDGLLDDEAGGYIVEEIKSTGAPLDELGEGREVHWAQARMYAYMILKNEPLPHIAIRLTYVRQGGSESRQLVRTETRESLEAFAAETVARYAPFAELKTRHQQRRDDSIRSLAFPFPAYRPGQRRLAAAVYKTAQEGVNLFAEAPTGIGKTMSTLFPAVKALGEGVIGGLYYLTAKTVNRLAAQDAVALLQGGGLRLHTVTLTAKEKACFCALGLCGKEPCPFAEGYYDRINDAVLDILGQETLMTSAVIAEYARKHQVCPFEYSLDLAYASDLVICDYNYIYDPRISFKRNAEERKKRTALLVDEAHNLVDRGREMYSAVLTKAPFLALQRRYKSGRKGLSAAAKAVNAFFIALRKSCGEGGTGRWDEYPEELPPLLEDFAAEAETELAAPVLAPPLPGDEEAGLLQDTYFAAQNMLRTFKLYDDCYITYAETGRGDVTLKLFNLDPSRLLRQMSKSYRSQIFFSATLSPLSYYRDMLGAGEGDYSLSVPSPFHKEQWQVSVLTVSTRYHERETSLVPLGDALMGMVSARKGNYLAFFPSYIYMQQVYEQFTGKYPEVRTQVQRTGMDEAEREGFLGAFQPDNPETLLGFAVLGGIFSEGVDLPGDRLNGVMVVGVGLPQVGLERNLLRAYFQAQGKNGFDYAYVIPGMCRVLQAGGRLIRSESDNGVIVLADDRFLQPPYVHLLPEEWKDYLVLD